MGMLASVYRQVDVQNVDGTAVMVDCTNGGWSSRFNSVCIVNVDGPFKPMIGRPGVLLVDGPDPNPNPIIVAKEHHDNNVWTQFGGNFLYTSDSRFSIAVDQIIGHRIGSMAVRIHDRIEQ